MKSSKFVQAIAAANILVSSHVAMAKGPISPIASHEFTEDSLISLDSEDSSMKLETSNSGCGNSGCGNTGCNK